MEIAFAVGIFCIGPLVFFTLGVWIGRGAPGWPWKLTRRQAASEQPLSAQILRRLD